MKQEKRVTCSTNGHSKNNCSLQELSNDLHIPKRTIKELIRKINVSLKQFLLIDEFIYSNHKGEIQTKETDQPKKLAVFLS